MMSIDAFLDEADAVLPALPESRINGYHDANAAFSVAAYHDAESFEIGSPESRKIKPAVSLPGGSVPIVETAQKLGKLLAATGAYFRRGGAVVKLDRDDDGEPILRPLRPATLPTAFETVAKLVKWRATGDGGGELAPATCPESTAKLILASDAFLDSLPPIRLLSRCPVLVERGGTLIPVVGYDRESGVLASGSPLPVVTVDEARSLLIGMVADFQFATEADKSRALAAIITPAMVHGGLLHGRAPVDLSEANASQTGKGYRNKLTAAVYRQVVAPVTQKARGVGSLEESFNSRLIDGACFIALDNIRGKIDSPAIESFLTEDRYSARVPYSGDVEIDPRRIGLMLTSNKAEVTRDLANRSSVVRILKRDEGHQFATFPEGDILDHVRAHQPKYLAAVFAILREWHRRGCPRTRDGRHDFRRWAQSLDWIVQNLLGCAPLLDGHSETRERMTNPTLNWLRDVALAVAQAGRLDEWLRAHDLLNILHDSGDVEIPGADAETDPEDDNSRRKLMQRVGRRIGQCFKGAATVTIDGYLAERQEAVDLQWRKTNETRFSADPASPRKSPAIKTPSPANPGTTWQHFETGCETPL
jgi:hypothetical protein